jgi:hypothetical protein
MQACRSEGWHVARLKIMTRSSGRAAGCACTLAPAWTTRHAVSGSNRCRRLVAAGGLRRPRSGSDGCSTPTRSPARSSGSARPRRGGDQPEAAAEQCPHFQVRPRAPSCQLRPRRGQEASGIASEASLRERDRLIAGLSTWRLERTPLGVPRWPCWKSHHGSYTYVRCRRSLSALGLIAGRSAGDAGQPRT